MTKVNKKLSSYFAIGFALGIIVFALLACATFRSPGDPVPTGRPTLSSPATDMPILDEPASQPTQDSIPPLSPTATPWEFPLGA